MGSVQQTNMGWWGMRTWSRMVTLYKAKSVCNFVYFRCYVDHSNTCSDLRRSTAGSLYNWSCQACLGEYVDCRSICPILFINTLNQSMCRINLALSWSDRSCVVNIVNDNPISISEGQQGWQWQQWWHHKKWWKAKSFNNTTSDGHLCNCSHRCNYHLSHSDYHCVYNGEEEAQMCNWKGAGREECTLWIIRGGPWVQCCPGQKS